MKKSTSLFLSAVVLLMLAAILRFWVAPVLELLPVDYRNETAYDQQNQFREGPEGEWQSSQLNVRRSDRAITSLSKVVIIQGDLQIYFEDDTLNFETSGLYGVERSTRLNLFEYGNEQRNGQYFFPTHVSKSQYTLWDPFYIGPQTLTFDHIEKLEGVQVYVFVMEVKGLDETDGYSYLPYVPEKYLAQTNATGTLWVEPLSGIVVNYRDQGASSLIDNNDQGNVAEFNTWTNTYTPDTRLSQLELARTTRLRMLVVELIFPALLLISSLLCFLAGWFKRKKASEVAVIT